jgi:hypothetical protein
MMFLLAPWGGFQFIFSNPQPAYAGCFSLPPSAAVIATFTASRLNK